MRIAVMGSGGIGGIIGARLSEAGADVSFIARGPHLAAMRDKGLSISSPFGDIVVSPVNASDDPAEIGPVDAVFFAVKTYDSEQAATAMRPLLSPSTRVVTIQNGIDSVATLSRYIPANQVIAGATYLSAFIGGPGEIVHSGATEVLVGCPRDRIVRALQQMSARAKGLELRPVEDIDGILWEKFVTLSAFSGATALTRAGIGRILADPEARTLIEQLRDESMAVAAASGHPMSTGFVDRVNTRWTVIAPDAKSSMAIDLERGKPIELAWLSGRMHELGISLGIPTPAHTAVYRALHLHARGPTDVKARK